MQVLNMGDFAGPQAVNDLHKTLVRMNNSLSETAVISFLNPFTFFKTFLSSLITTQFFHFIILHHTPKKNFPPMCQCSYLFLLSFLNLNHPIFFLTKVSAADYFGRSNRRGSVVSEVDDVSIPDLTSVSVLHGAVMLSQACD